jgi:site-specific DNA-cytosine methylase
MKTLIDLCSGLGGFSKAFTQSSDWQVVTVDIEKKFKPTLVADVRKILESPENFSSFWTLKPDLILASPPCTHFSLANPIFPRVGIYESLSIVGACLEIIANMKPRFYILENPKGRLRWYIGEPVLRRNLITFGYKTVKPSDFWTNIHFESFPRDSSRNPDGISFANNVPGDSAKRALIPLGFSEYVKSKVEAQL